MGINTKIFGKHRNIMEKKKNGGFYSESNVAMSNEELDALNQK